MSKTDNTRPIEVIETDPSTLRIPRNSGAVTYHIAGGANSSTKNGADKLNRRHSHSRVRRHVGDVLRQARHVLDRDDIDLPPHRAERRQFGWRTGLA